MKYQNSLQDKTSYVDRIIISIFNLIFPSENENNNLRQFSETTTSLCN